MNFSDHQEIEVVVSPNPRSVRSLRWWIGGLLFASTVINYVDRQTLSLLAPFLKLEYHWSNTDYANLVIAFRVAYSISAWTVYQCRILFTSFNADAARSGSRQFCFLPISFGSRRIGELACCDQSGLGVVSETRARTSDCAFRQWIIGWRRHLTVHRFVDLFPVGMASSVHRPRIARIGMVNSLAALLLSSRATSAHL